MNIDIKFTFRADLISTDSPGTYKLAMRPVGCKVTRDDGVVIVNIYTETGAINLDAAAKAVMTAIMYSGHDLKGVMISSEVL